MRTVRSKPRYRWTISDKSFLKAANLKLRQGNGEAPVGQYLKNYLNKLNIHEDTISTIHNLTTQSFLDALNKTRRYAILAESEITADGKDWTKEELSIMGDMSVVMDDVTVFDNGSSDPNGKDAVNVDLGAPKFTLGFVAGALFAGCAVDLSEVILDNPHDPRLIGEQAYLNLKKLYERRLLPVLIEFNNKAKNENKKAFVSVPGLGCGKFSGQFQQGLHQAFGCILQDILKDHVSDLSSIGIVRYFNADFKASNMQVSSLKIADLIFDNVDPSRYRGFDNPEPEMMPCKVVDWNHASYPANHAILGKRETDGGITGACTNVLDAFTSSGDRGAYLYQERFFFSPHNAGPNYPNNAKKWINYLFSKRHSLNTEHTLQIVEINEKNFDQAQEYPSSTPINAAIGHQEMKDSADQVDGKVYVKIAYENLHPAIKKQLSSFEIEKDQYDAADIEDISGILVISNSYLASYENLHPAIKEQLSILKIEKDQYDAADIEYISNISRIINSCFIASNENQFAKNSNKNLGSETNSSELQEKNDAPNQEITSLEKGLNDLGFSYDNKFNDYKLIQDFTDVDRLRFGNSGIIPPVFSCASNFDTIFNKHENTSNEFKATVGSFEPKALLHYMRKTKSMAEKLKCVVNKNNGKISLPAEGVNRDFINEAIRYHVIHLDDEAFSPEDAEKILERVERLISSADFLEAQSKKLFGGAEIGINYSRSIVDDNNIVLTVKPSSESGSLGTVKNVLKAINCAYQDKILLFEDTVLTTVLMTENQFIGYVDDLKKSIDLSKNIADKIGFLQISPSFRVSEPGKANGFDPRAVCIYGGNPIEYQRLFYNKFVNNLLGEAFLVDLNGNPMTSVDPILTILNPYHVTNNKSVCQDQAYKVIDLLSRREEVMNEVNDHLKTLGITADDQLDCCLTFECNKSRFFNMRDVNNAGLFSFDIDQGRWNQLFVGKEKNDFEQREKDCLGFTSLPRGFIKFEQAKKLSKFLAYVANAAAFSQSYDANLGQSYNAYRNPAEFIPQENDQKWKSSCRSALDFALETDLNNCHYLPFKQIKPLVISENNTQGLFVDGWKNNTAFRKFSIEIIQTALEVRVDNDPKQLTSINTICERMLTVNPNTDLAMEIMEKVVILLNEEKDENRIKAVRKEIQDIIPLACENSIPQRANAILSELLPRSLVTDIMDYNKNLVHKVMSRIYEMRRAMKINEIESGLEIHCLTFTANMLASKGFYSGLEDPSDGDALPGKRTNYIPAEMEVAFRKELSNIIASHKGCSEANSAAMCERMSLKDAALMIENSSGIMKDIAGFQSKYHEAAMNEKDVVLDYIKGKLLKFNIDNACFDSFFAPSYEEGIEYQYAALNPEIFSKTRINIIEILYKMNAEQVQQPQPNPQGVAANRVDVVAARGYNR